MNTAAENHYTSRGLSSIVAELKQELKEFVDTRIAMFKSELREKAAHWKIALPLAAVGAVLLATAYLLLVASVVALVAAFIPDSPYRWFFALLGVTVLWSLLGAIALFVAKREFEPKKLIPQRTIEVLKGDKLWLQQEARNQI